MGDDRIPIPRSKLKTQKAAPQTLTQTLSPPEFSHLIAKTAVAQIFKSFGFKGAQSSALDALTRIAALYIQSIAESAASRTAVCGGRTQCNLFDVIGALEELRLPSGFPGAGDVGRPLLSSSTLKELDWFVNAVDEVPFARRIPRPETGSGSVVFPGNSRSLVGNRAEVPRWLPGFPEVVEDPKRVSKREAFWEEKAFDQPPPPPPIVKTEKEEGEKRDQRFLLAGRRERVKFRLGMRNGKMGMDGLELRNGICRGGKRVCLAKRVNTFAEEDEVEDIQTGIVKSI